MKTLALFAFIILSFSIQAQATFGVRAGINVATVNFQSDGFNISPDSRVGLTVAGLANIPVNESFSIQPEVHFIQKGYKFELEFFGEVTETTAKLNYLEVPIHAKYAFGNENLRFFILAGPAIGFALGGEVEQCDGGDCISEDIEFDDNDGFNRLDLGLSVGAGMNIGSNFFVDLRYVLGITNLSEDDADDIKTTNRGIQIGVGYMFGGE